MMTSLQVQLFLCAVKQILKFLFLNATKDNTLLILKFCDSLPLLSTDISSGTIVADASCDKLLSVK